MLSLNNDTIQPISPIYLNIYLPGYESEGMFEAAKEAEMSVSDPEEYLVSRSDEDVLFPPHSMYVCLFVCTSKL